MIDGFEIIHDLGRRLPQPYDFTKNIKAETLLNYIRLDPLRVKAFYIHHALDFMEKRLAAIKVLGESLDKYCELIVKGIMMDLKQINKKLRESSISIPLTKDMINELEAKLPKVCYDEELMRYVETSIVSRLKELSNLNNVVKEYVKITSKVYSKSTKYRERMQGSLKQANLYYHKELAEIYTDKYKDRLLHWHAIKLASQASGIYFAFLLLPMPLLGISEVFFSIKKGLLGKSMLECFNQYRDNEERFKCILRRIKNLEKTYLSKYGIKISKERIKNFFDILNKLLGPISNIENQHLASLKYRHKMLRFYGLTNKNSDNEAGTS